MPWPHVGQINNQIYILLVVSISSDVKFCFNISNCYRYVYGIGGGTGCPQHKDRSCYSCHRLIDHTQIQIKGFMTITSSGNSSYAGWPLAKASYSSLRWKWLTRPLATTVLLAGLRHHSVVMGEVLRLFCLVGYENSLTRRPQMMWKDMYHLHPMRLGLVTG